VRMCSSTRIPPRWPISIPAIFASAVSGRTPIARITMSAGCTLPELARTSSEPSADCRNPATPSLSSSRTPCFAMYRSTRRAISGRAGHDLVELLDQRHFEPAVDQFSTISRPMNPRRPPPHAPVSSPSGIPCRYSFRIVPPHPGRATRVCSLRPARSSPRRSPEGRCRAAADGSAPPGRQHELVVVLGGHLAGRVVLEVHGFLPGRDADHLAARPAIDGELPRNVCFRRHQEARLFFDRAPTWYGSRSSRTKHTVRVPP